MSIVKIFLTSKQKPGVSSVVSVVTMYKCGYCSWLSDIDGENINEHSCFAGFNPLTEDLVADDNYVVTIAQKHEVPVGQQQAVKKRDIDEELVRLVAQRPALYNTSSTPPSERTPLKKKALWTEIYNCLDQTTDVEGLKKRWQYLRDCYVKAKKKVKEYIPSGSGARPKVEPPFRFYSMMTFLDDTLEPTVTVSSIPSSLVSPSPSASTTDTWEDQFTPKTSAPAPKKRKKNPNSELEEALVDVLKESTVEQTRPLDAIDGLLLRIGEGLRRLPFRRRATLEIKFLQLLLEAETEETNNEFS